ncbi:MAG: serpin family protein, partial [Bacilli bacterium]|nr:serpin family protein [Bacilli bacterium]
AAAFTFHGMTKESAAEPLDKVEFVLDHPFIYQIYDVNGCVLFMGVVNNPNK